MEVNYEVILKAVKIVFFRTLCVDKSGDFLKQAENEYHLIKQVQVQIVNCIATWEDLGFPQVWERRYITVYVRFEFYHMI